MESVKEDIPEENITLDLLNPESIHKAVEDVIEYSPGTNIYFGSTIALQVINSSYNCQLLSRAKLFFNL